MISSSLSTRRHEACADIAASRQRRNIFPIVSALRAGRLATVGLSSLRVIVPFAFFVLKRPLETPMDIRKLLIAAGGVLLLAGLLWPWLSRLGLGRLPGDIVIERGSSRFYFPVVTCILISVVLSLVAWLIRAVAR